MIFAEAQAIFRQLRERAVENQEATQEFESALTTLVETYNTAIHENRFVVGGATEVLLCAWIKALGFACEWRSEIRTDLWINEVPFSVKANFARSSTIRLINVLGASPNAEWNTPLLALLAEEGLFYADPTLVEREAIVRKADVLEVKTRSIRQLRAQGWCISIDVPRKPDTGAPSQVASYDVARAVLEKIASQVLAAHFPKPH
ncbi:MAG: hypothetical protein D6802_02630 [Ardenticatenia bacterium]|nr:MAG: hypothetical protein D6802_02630 [Ardenticatenia bacterium]